MGSTTKIKTLAATVAYTEDTRHAKTLPKRLVQSDFPYTSCLIVCQVWSILFQVAEVLNKKKNEGDEKEEGKIT